MIQKLLKISLLQNSFNLRSLFHLYFLKMNFLILLFICSVVAIQGFKITPSKTLFFSKLKPSLKLNSIKITDNVEFDTIAREWRLKWSSENEKQSLSLVQEKLGSILPTLQKIEGVKNVQRVVCGGCLDFKIITSVSAEKFQEWVRFNSFKFRI